MTTAATNVNPTALTLPRATFAKVSPDAFLTAHLLNGTDVPKIRRPNGRSPSEFRTPTCNVGSLSHCVGSTVIRTGDTAVVCGIQAEILLAKSIANPPGGKTSSDEIGSLNLLVPNVELATGCSPAHLPGSGGPPSTEAQSLSQRILHLLLTSQMVDIKDLRIEHTPAKLESNGSELDDVSIAPQTVAYWTLYPSIHVLSLSGINSLIDAAWAALVIALRNVRLPHAWWNPDMEYVLCSDQPSEAKELNLQCMPFASTWGCFVVKKNTMGKTSDEGEPSQDRKDLKSGDKAWLLADPDSLEDPLCRGFVTIFMDCSNGRTKILKIDKNGESDIGLQDLNQLHLAAKQRWLDWKEIIT